MKKITDRQIHSCTLAAVLAIGLGLASTLPSQYQTIERVDRLTDRLIALEDSQHAQQANLTRLETASTKGQAITASMLAEHQARISRLEIAACRLDDSRPVQCQ